MNELAKISIEISTQINSFSNAILKNPNILELRKGYCSLLIIFKTEIDYYFSEFETPNSSIPTPKEVIGHEVGEWHVTHDKLVQYMYALADASNRITIEDRGKTFEGRPILLLTITSEDNHNNINQIIANHKKITEYNEYISIEDQPIVVYQGFSIHGNEASGSNASLLLCLLYTSPSPRD